MAHKYDNYGWYVGEAEGDRCTEDQPANLSVSEIEGALRANWTGYEWNDLPYVKPAPAPDPATPVPASITPRQGYIILSRYGLLTPVKAYFAALEGQEGEEAQIELEFAQEWKRSWPTLINAAQSFGLTDAQIDQMFVEASAL